MLVSFPDPPSTLEGGLGMRLCKCALVALAARAVMIMGHACINVEVALNPI